jgi:hypothetical protein
MKNRTPLLSVVVGCAVMGIMLDFLMNGVLKVVWIAITGPTYVVAASTLATALKRSRWSAYTSRGVVGLLVGTILGHLIFQNHGEVRTYPMSRVPSSLSQAVAFRSDDFPETLFVTSPKLQRELDRRSNDSSVPVSVTIQKDYGCIRSFRVSTVAGVDVLTDTDATWTWKIDKNNPGKPFTGVDPHDEDQALIWCRFHPF